MIIKTSERRGAILAVYMTGGGVKADLYRSCSTGFRRFSSRDTPARIRMTRASRDLRCRPKTDNSRTADAGEDSGARVTQYIRTYEYICPSLRKRRSP